VIDDVERADANPAFLVAVTGNTTVDHDFNALSERDLQGGRAAVRAAGPRSASSCSCSGRSSPVSSHC
jgi:hypothetical protein